MKLEHFSLVKLQTGEYNPTHFFAQCESTGGKEGLDASNSPESPNVLIFSTESMDELSIL